MGIFDKFKRPSPAERVASDAANTRAEPSVAAAPPPPAAKQGFFDKLKQGLKKTGQFLNTDIRDLFKSEGRLVNDAFLDNLLEILIKTDMGVQAAGQIIETVSTDFRARVVHMSDILDVVKAKLKQLMDQGDTPLHAADSPPTVLMIVGVNGSGKTTSIAKLTYLFRSQGKKVVLGAGDTFRAAAADQLAIWAERLGAEIVRADKPGADPASVAFRAVTRAVESGAEICIVDTAGRLQTQQNLMQELTKIRRVIGNKAPGAPHEVLLVLDATGGQNGLSQARGFSEAVSCTGIFLAKIDGTAKGGIVAPIRQQFGIPVKFVGVGEKAEDIAPFDPDEFVDAMFEGLAAQA